MKISLYLRTTYTREDGKQAIFLRCSHRNQRKFSDALEWIPPHWWDPKEKRVRSVLDNKKNPDADRINASLQAEKQLMIDYAKNNPFTDPVEVVAKYNLPAPVEVVKKKNAITLLDYMEKRIEDAKLGKLINPDTSLPYSEGTAKGWDTSLKRLQAFARARGSFSWESIDRAFYERLLDYLRTEYKTKENEYLRENSIGGTIKNLKSFITAAMDEELEEVPVVTAHLKKYFKKPKEETDSEVLTIKHLDHLRRMDLQWRPAMDEERTRFLLAYNTLLRDSDRIDVGKGNILIANDQRFIRKRQTKGNKPVIVPCTEEAFRIIESGYKPGHNTSSNLLLKDLCMLAGFDEMRTHTYRVAGVLTSVTQPLFTLVGTHTARRSGATQLFLWGETIENIRDWGGWKRTSQAEEYVKADLWEQAIDYKKRGKFFKSSFIK